LIATISGKTNQVSCVFGACVFGANEVWGKTAFSGIHELCESFRSKFKAMSFQGFHWLQKVGSGKASFAAKVVQ